jgi:hypothetical protein
MDEGGLATDADSEKTPRRAGPMNGNGHLLHTSARRSRRRKASSGLLGLLLPFFAFPVLLPGCGPENPRAEDSGFQVRDSAGVDVVTNPSVGALGADTLTLEEELRIGVVEGEDHYQFYQVDDLAMDEAGTLFVGNTMTGTVRVFTSGGEFVREFGGRGEGPAEVSMVNQVWLAGDSVVVVDWQRGGKTVVFTKTGELVASWRSMHPEGRRITLFGFGPEGWVGFSDPPYRDRIREAPEGEPVELRRDLRYVFPGQDSVGNVFVRLPPQVLYGSSETHGLDWGLFGHRTDFGFDAAGKLFLSRGHPYEIDVFDSRGNLTRRVRRAYDPVLITEDHVRDVVEELPAPLDTMSRLPPEEREDQKERVVARVKRQASFPHPDTLGCLGRLLVARDGAFWVERVDGVSPIEIELRKMWFGLQHSSETPTIWDVFDPEGRFLGTVRLPARFGPMAVEERAVVGVLKDAMDVEYVVRYRIVPPSP